MNLNVRKSGIAAGSAWDRSSYKCPETEHGRCHVLSGSTAHSGMHAGRNGGVECAKREDEAAHDDKCYAESTMIGQVTK